MSYLGAVINRQITFYNIAGNIADPAVVNANAKRPNGTSVLGSVVKQSVGVYDALFTGDMVGLWFFRIEGEGNNVDAVTEGSFCVRESSVE